MRNVIARLRSGRGLPLYRSSFALMLTTVLNGIVGFLFWLLAARLYPARIVSVGAGAISAMTLISSLGWVGLQYMLLRFIPVAGSKRRYLATLSYVIAIAVSLVAAGIFLAGFAPSAGLGLLVRNPATVAAFLGSVALWVVFSLQDAILVGLRRASWVPPENATFGVIKLVLLVLFAGSVSAWAIFGAWMLGGVGLIIVINVALYGRFLRADPQVPEALPGRRALFRFAGGHHAVAVVAAIPDSLVSLLVLSFLARKENAFYYSAWAVSFSLRLLAVNMSSALLVEGAHAQDQVRRLVRQVGTLALTVFIPVVVVVVAAAGPIMRLFGAGYGSAAGLLRLFAASLVPFAIVNFALAVERIRQRVGPALLIACTSTISAIALDVWLIPKLGIEGAGVGWLVAQLLATLVVVVVMAREIRPGGEAQQPRDRPPT